MILKPIRRQDADKHIFELFNSKNELKAMAISVEDTDIEIELDDLKYISLAKPIGNVSFVVDYQSLLNKFAK